MKIRLNERDIEIDEETTIGALLSARGVSTENTALEINGEIGDEDALDRPVKDGDCIVVVTFVGGG